ncbi:MAG: hypothetical protein WKH97_01455 [Casimicrobiaceae bacterium]
MNRPQCALTLYCILVVILILVIVVIVLVVFTGTGSNVVVGFADWRLFLRAPLTGR